MIDYLYVLFRFSLMSAGAASVPTHFDGSVPSSEQ